LLVAPGGLFFYPLALNVSTTYVNFAFELIQARHSVNRGTSKATLRRLIRLIRNSTANGARKDSPGRYCWQSTNVHFSHSFEL